MQYWYMNTTNYGVLYQHYNAQLWSTNTRERPFTQCWCITTPNNEYQYVETSDNGVPTQENAHLRNADTLQRPIMSTNT
jgi:hypothetical protein